MSVSSFLINLQLQGHSTSLKIFHLSMKLAVALLTVAQVTTGFAPIPSTGTSLASSGSSALYMADKFKVFIDGEAGTTGLQVRGRIEARDDLEIMSAPDELRKDEDTRKSLINEADVVILCTYLMICICRRMSVRRLLIWAETIQFSSKPLERARKHLN